MLSLFRPDIRPDYLSCLPISVYLRCRCLRISAPRYTQNRTPNKPGNILSFRIGTKRAAVRSVQRRLRLIQASALFTNRRHCSRVWLHMRARLQTLTSASSVASTDCRRHVLVPRFFWDTSPCWPSFILCYLETCTRSYMLIRANIARARSSSCRQLIAKSGGSISARLIEYCKMCQITSPSTSTTKRSPQPQRLWSVMARYITLFLHPHGHASVRKSCSRSCAASAALAAILDVHHPYDRLFRSSVPPAAHVNREAQGQ